MNNIMDDLNIRINSMMLLDNLLVFIIVYLSYFYIFIAFYN